MNRSLHIADLFCGAGGTTTGAMMAASDLGRKPVVTAINHWPVAIATHQKNHPEARHLLTAVDAVNPRDHYKEGQLDILWASPECMHHSNARGGKPINDQSRATAYCVTRWADALLPKVILVENVPEFVNWGPLKRRRIKIDQDYDQDIFGTKKPKHRYEYYPDPVRKGETFRAWIAMLESSGYKVDWRILRAADYGDATTRRRLIIQAVRGRRKIVWPNPTHAKEPGSRLLPWVPARDIIDWTIPSQSIYARKKPLAEKTFKRILKGFLKYGLHPYLIPQLSGGAPRSVDDPVHTITGSGRGNGICEPFLTILRGQSETRSIGQPLPTVTSGGGHHGLVQGELIPVDRRHDLAQYLLRYNGEFRLQDLDKPLGTQDTSNRYGLVQSYLLDVNHGGQGDRSHAIENPLNTLTTRGSKAVVLPYLIKFYSTGGQWSRIDDPISTVTTKDRIGLVIPSLAKTGDDQAYLIDFHFRMLQPKEMAAAHSFPADYVFIGTKEDQVKQIGNSVPSELSRALVRAVVSQNPDWNFDGDQQEAAG